MKALAAFPAGVANRKPQPTGCMPTPRCRFSSQIPFPPMSSGCGTTRMPKVSGHAALSASGYPPPPQGSASPAPKGLRKQLSSLHKTACILFDTPSVTRVRAVYLGGYRLKGQECHRFKPKAQADEAQPSIPARRFRIAARRVLVRNSERTGLRIGLTSSACLSSPSHGISLSSHIVTASTERQGAPAGLRPTRAPHRHVWYLGERLPSGPMPH